MGRNQAFRPCPSVLSVEGGDRNCNSSPDDGIFGGVSILGLKIAVFASYRILRYAVPMRLISNKALREFGMRHKAASEPLQAWRKLIECNNFGGFAELKRTFNSVDKVGDFHIFDIAGNHYRLIAAIHFNTQTLYVREVLTHAEYDKWRP